MADLFSLNSILKTLILSCLVLLSTYACSDASRSLISYFPNDNKSVESNAQLDFINEEIGLTLTPYKLTGPNKSPIALVSSRVVDLSIVANNAPYKDNINVVLPLFTGVLHMLVRNDLDETIDENFLEGKTIFIKDPTEATREFIKYRVKYRGLDPSKINIIDEFIPGETDVIIIFAPVMESWQNLEGYRLISIGNPQNLGQGTPAEAMSYLVPQLQPFVIPAQTYPGLLGNENAVLTISVDVLLITHDQTNQSVIYELTETLMENRNKLASILPSVFYSLSDNFDPLGLTFPLHPGSRAYVERNEPSFLERYAETINVIVYLIVIGITAILALMRWNHQKKKDRIDKFYVKLFEIRDVLRRDEQPVEYYYLDSLYQIEREAFDLLINEKVAADESFNIFLTLLNETVELAREKQSH